MTVSNSQVYSNDELNLWPVYSGERFRDSWHSCLQVAMPTDSQNSDANILKNLKYNTWYEVRIKVVNKYGSERYTGIHTIRTKGTYWMDG